MLQRKLKVGFARAGRLARTHREHAAIANAIYHAIGVRMNVLPMSPARILEGLWADRSDRS